VGPRTGPDVSEEQKILFPLPKIEPRFLSVAVRNLVTVIPVDTHESAGRNKLPSASTVRDATLCTSVQETQSQVLLIFPLLMFMKGPMTARSYSRNK
jgi:hypothetical protein